MTPQPIAAVEWIAAGALVANPWNPNVQPPPEYRLLKISLLEDGWTQPIVIFDAGDGPPIIVDGEHRWRLASTDPEVAALTDGLVPVVRIRKARESLMMSTIRHNRARGEHTIRQMGVIVRDLLARGTPLDDVCFLLQMEAEEVDRLTDTAGMPTRATRDVETFAKGWTPGP